MVQHGAGGRGGASRANWISLILGGGPGMAILRSWWLCYTVGMANFDMMRHIRVDVSTVCVGLAASLGTFLLSSGSKGKRYSLPNSRIMIYQPLGGAQGQQTDIEIQADEILHHKANLNGHLPYRTGQPLEKIVQDTDRDFFMSANGTKEYGLIDVVISNPPKELQPLSQPKPSAA
ncbi:hypothetical protein GOP47_0025747 [Adiantum capillus-veneris]|uniref:ATP-dependent Clp protease proteolytic subunit n=1 Tax=Adiantum capillus-veneris TaxID=13818 RepID=A0A9D4U131_ADICA|nr:hypothetical protein GOP47_0025747 [Adiantum capillus-veneris]